MIYVTGLGHTHYRVDQEIGVCILARSYSELSVKKYVSWVCLAEQRFTCVSDAWDYVSEKRRSCSSISL